MKDVVIYDDTYDLIMTNFSDPVRSPSFAKALWVFVEMYVIDLEKESATRQ